MPAQPLNYSLFLCLDNLKQLQNPWTKLLIAAVTKFMFDKNLYQDCLQDNLSAQQRSQDPLYAAYKPKQNFEAIRREREQTAKQIQALQKEIDNDLASYKTLRPSFDSPTDDMKKLSEKIYNSKLKLYELNERYQTKHVVPKDIELLQSSLHYTTGKGNHTSAGKNATVAIKAFLENEFLPQPQSTATLINVYETVNAIAAMRQRLLSPCENAVTKSTYLNHKNQQSNYTANASLLTGNFSADSKRNSKIEDSQRKEILMEHYLSFYSESTECIKKMSSLLKDYLNKEKINQTQRTAVQKIMLMVDDSSHALRGEHDYLQTTLKDEPSKESVKTASIRIR